MKKIFLTILLILCMSTVAFAADPISAPTVTPDQVISIFPNATQVTGVATYLFNAKDVGIGPAYQIIKVYGLVGIDAQFASLSKGGSYAGIAGEVTVCDVLAKVNKTCNSTLVSFNPSLGVTAGWTGGGAIVKPWDYGIRLNVLKVDLSKVAGWLGF